MASNWDDANVELLKKLWGEGLSASQIAQRLPGDITRSAVIGKVHRIGLNRDSTVKVKRRLVGARGGQFARSAKRATPPTPPARPVAVVRPVPPSDAPPRQPMPAIPVEDYHGCGSDKPLPAGEGKRLVDLEGNDCRWPHGDPRSDEFRFCARAKVPGMAYCVDHALQAFMQDGPGAAQRVRGWHHGPLGGGSGQKKIPAAGDPSKAREKATEEVS